MIFGLYMLHNVQLRLSGLCCATAFGTLPVMAHRSAQGYARYHCVMQTSFCSLRTLLHDVHCGQSSVSFL